MILHLPHSSRLVPPDLRATLLLDDAALDAELTRMTDAFTDETFSFLGAVPIVHPVSRLIVDPERFPEDADEPMAARGMGVLYTRTSAGRPLRAEPSPSEREALLDRFYRPHHAALERAVEAELERHGRALVIDCHSFPSRPLPCDLDPLFPRPEICLGTDGFHTPGALLAVATRACEANGWSVGIDRPYAGTLVPMRYYRRDARVASVMIEVRRDLYMDEGTGERGAGLEGCRGRLTGMLEALASWASRPAATG